MVFPLGMYAAASQAFGQAAGIGLLGSIATVDVWIALAAWLATFVGLIGEVRKLIR